MDEDSGSGLMNNRIKLAHECWGKECDGQIVVTLAQFVANYFARCPKCCKPESTEGGRRVSVLKQ